MRTWSEGPSWLGTLACQATEDRSVNNLEGNGDDDGDQIFVNYKENGDFLSETLHFGVFWVKIFTF